MKQKEKEEEENKHQNKCFSPEIQYLDIRINWKAHALHI